MEIFLENGELIIVGGIMNKDISNIKYKCVICKKKFKGSETFRNHLCLMRVLDPKLFITMVEGAILIRNAKYGIFNRSIRNDIF